MRRALLLLAVLCALFANPNQAVAKDKPQPPDQPVATSPPVDPCHKKGIEWLFEIDPYFFMDTENRNFRLAIIHAPEVTDDTVCIYLQHFVSMTQDEIVAAGLKPYQVDRIYVGREMVEGDYKWDARPLTVRTDNFESVFVRDGKWYFMFSTSVVEFDPDTETLVELPLMRKWYELSDNPNRYPYILGKPKEPSAN